MRLQVRYLTLLLFIISACTPKANDRPSNPILKHINSSSPAPVNPSDPNFVSQNITLNTPDSLCPPYVFQPNFIATMLDPMQLPNMEGLPRELKTINTELDPYGFGCYGACGPSCKATCRDIPNVEKVYRVKNTEGAILTRICTYKRFECLSDLRCRKHDECYRQVDLKYYIDHNKDLSSPPSTLGTTGYRLCDVKGPFLDEASKIQRWFNVTDPSQLTPQERNLCFANYIVGNVQTGIGDCWDGTTTKYADLIGERTMSNTDANAVNAIAYP